MVKRFAPLGAIGCVLLAASGAVCQKLRQSLPDAPSVPAVTLAQKSGIFFDEARSAPKFGAMGGKVGLVLHAGFAAPAKALFGHKESSNVFKQFLYSSMRKQQSGYHSSSSDTLMGRAAYAGSRIFIRRDEFGKSRPNTLYLLRALTSVAAATASRPYWKRTLGEPFGDFGSTVGNEAGINLWHEFGRDIEQLMKSRTARLFPKSKEHIDHK